VSYQLVYDYLPSVVVLTNLLMQGSFCPEKHNYNGKMETAELTHENKNEIRGERIIQSYMATSRVIQLKQTNSADLSSCIYLEAIINIWPISRVIQIALRDPMNVSHP
jgi:hypothetical protein